MSVTILKTLRTWQAVRAAEGSVDHPTPLRGRVITGMLTGDDRDRPPDSDGGGPREPR
ncbi:MAG: hypothetical protein ABIY55_25940 [Kofleriaceae bacterium]